MRRKRQDPELPGKKGEFQRGDVISKNGVQARFERYVGDRVMVRFLIEINRPRILRDEGWMLVERSEARRRRLGMDNKEESK